MAGARQVVAERPVPSVEAEDRRPWPRACTTAKRERRRVRNRSQGWLAAHGLARPPGRDGPQPAEPLRRWDGPPLPAGLRPRLTQAGEPVVACAPRLAPWDADAGPGSRRRRRRSRKSATTPEAHRDGAQEGLAGRDGACRRAGCAPSAGGRRPERPDAPPGEWHHRLLSRVSPAGNAHSRALALERAWGWRRLQPQRALTQGEQRAWAWQEPRTPDRDGRLGAHAAHGLVAV